MVHLTQLPLDRRSVLGALLLGAAHLIAPRRLAATEPRGFRVVLSAAERRHAELGRIYFQQEPRYASHILLQARSALMQCENIAACELPQRARVLFLHAEVVRHQLEREETVLVDGWPLTLSEASYCLLLHDLQRRHSPQSA